MRENAAIVRVYPRHVSERERPMTLMQLPDLPKGVRPVVTPIVDTADAAFVMSLDCQFLAWGSRAQQLFGFSPPDVLGRYCYIIRARCTLTVTSLSSNLAAISLLRECGATRRERRRERGATLEQLPMSSQSSRFVLRHQIFEWLRRLLEEVSIEFRDSLRFRYERFICVLCVFALNLHQLGGLFNTGQLRSEFRSMLH